MEFMIRLADVNIAVNSMHDEVFRLCRDYLTDGTTDFYVSPAPADIALERVKNMREAETEGLPPVDYPAPYLETLAVYRKIAAEMLRYDTLLLHGAVVAVKDKAWLFTAPSGTGKTFNESTFALFISRSLAEVIIIDLSIAPFIVFCIY